MAIPSKKSFPMEQFIKRSFGVDRKESISQDTCTFCKKPATEFRDKLSEKEFTISGLCQNCQDQAFGKGE